MNIKKYGNHNYDIIHFSWTLIDYCNYSCYYCSEKHKLVDDSRNKTISTHQLIIQRLKRFDKPFNIDLFGGEPTLHPNLPKIIDDLIQIELCRVVNIITNLSRPIAYFEKINEKKSDKVFVLASFHLEYFNDGFIEKIIKINNMQHISLEVIVNLTEKSEDWPTIVNFIEILKKNNIKYLLHSLQNTRLWSVEYKQEFFDTFKPLEYKIPGYEFEYEDGTIKTFSNLEVQEKGLHQLTGVKCNPKYFIFELDGTLKNVCTEEIFKKIVFNSKDIDKEVTCSTETCGCEIMYNFPKKQNEIV